HAAHAAAAQFLQDTEGTKPAELVGSLRRFEKRQLVAGRRGRWSGNRQLVAIGDRLLRPLLRGQVGPGRLRRSRFSRGCAQSSSPSVECTRLQGNHLRWGTLSKTCTSWTMPAASRA